MQKSHRKRFKCLRLVTNLLANFNHQMNSVYVNIFYRITTLALSIFEFFHQMFDSSDFPVSLSGFLCHLINGLLNTVHDFVLKLDLIVFANDFLDLMNSIIFDSIQFILDFSIVIKLFV